MNATNFSLFYQDQSQRGRLTLTGKDRQTFLQGMVTNDVLRQKPGQGCYTFILDSTGHVLADASVFCAVEYLLLSVEGGMASFVRETLERYVIMERVTITDVTTDFGEVLLGGTDAPALLQKIGVNTEGWSEGQHTETTCADSPMVVSATRAALYPTFTLFGVAENMVDWLQSEGVIPIEETISEGLRIQAGIPRFGKDIDSRVLAPETNQQQRAISYKKGCYIGQEIVARIDARGRVNRGLCGFRLTEKELPERDTPVTVEGKEVGRVTSAAKDPLTHAPIALGYIRKEYAEPGTTVTIRGNHATVSDLPFVTLP
jgi:folate-binding protein YgfZ